MELKELIFFINRVYNIITHEQDNFFRVGYCAYSLQSTVSLSFFLERRFWSGGGCVEDVDDDHNDNGIFIRFYGSIISSDQRESCV